MYVFLAEHDLLPPDHVRPSPRIPSLQGWHPLSQDVPDYFFKKMAGARLAIRREVPRMTFIEWIKAKVAL